MSATNDMELPADVDELKKLVLTLQKQLAAAGVDPTAASISLDKAKEMLHAALTRLMDGDQKAQGEYDKWDKLVSCHPEHLEEQEKQEREWEEAMKTECQSALEDMKKIVPCNIKNLRADDVAKIPGMHATLAKRLLRKKALWLLHVPTEDISKFHAADLMVKFSISGLDFRELKALYAVVPKVMDNDADGRKTEWRMQLKRKVREFSDKEKSGNLPSNKIISPDYSEKKKTSRRKSTGSIKNPFGGKRGGKGGGMGNLAAMLEMKLKSKGGTPPVKKKVGGKLGGIASKLEGKLFKNSPGGPKVRGKIGGIAASLEGKLFKGSPGGPLGGGKLRKNRRSSLSGALPSSGSDKNKKIKGIAASLEGKLFKSSIKSGGNKDGITPVRRKSKKMVALTSALENSLFKEKNGKSKGKCQTNGFTPGSRAKISSIRNSDGIPQNILETRRASPDDVASPDLHAIMHKTSSKLQPNAKRQILNEEHEENTVDTTEGVNELEKRSHEEKVDQSAKLATGGTDSTSSYGKNVVVVSKSKLYLLGFLFVLIAAGFIQLYISSTKLSTKSSNLEGHRDEKHNDERIHAGNDDAPKIHVTHVKVDKESREENKNRKFAAPPKHKIKKTCAAKGGYGAGCVYTANGAVSLNAGDGQDPAENKPDPAAIARAQEARQAQSRKSKYKKWQEEKKKKNKNA